LAQLTEQLVGRGGHLEPKPRKVLVAGATGFVGRALVPALVAEGYEVRATTRSLARSPGGAGVEWVECDVHVRAAPALSG